MSDASARQRTEAGRSCAMTLIERGMRFSDVVAALVKDFDVSERTAKRWYTTANKALLAKMSEIDTSDLDGTRWTYVRIAEQRARRFREEADDILKTCTDTVDKGYAVKFERLSLDYFREVVRILHFDKIPPDRDLDLPEIQEATVSALIRHCDDFPVEMLKKLLAAVAARIEDSARDLEEGDADAAAVEEEDQGISHLM